MATTQDAISRLQIQATTPGVDDATQALNKLAEAQGGVAVASASVEKATASLDTKFASIERRYVDGVKAQQDYAKVQATVNAAVAQNPALTDRANAVLAAAKQRYDDLTGSQSKFEKALESAQEKASELTRELGPLGSVLAGIGPAGIAVGAAIGVAVLALDALKERAEEAGRWASQLQNAANIIGLNTTQLQALNEAAATVGVSANDNVAAFERFSVSLGQLRDGSGSLYSELLKVNPALVNQLSVTKDAATGWNLLAQAYAQADKTQQALIARAAFGRGGAAQGGVLLATANAGGISGLEAANQEDAISKEQVKRWADLTVQINSATEAAGRNFASIFTDAILTREKNFAENMLAISQRAKEFVLSEDWKKFTDFLSSDKAQSVLSLLGKVFVPAPIAAGVGLLSAGAGALFGPAKPAAGAGQQPAGFTPDFNYAFGAVDKSNSAAAAASLGVQATQAKAMVAALGSAATAQERLDATTKQLAVDLANNTITATTYDRAIAGAKLDAAISMQTAYNSALGSAATTNDLVAAKELQLQKLRQQGAPITQDQVDKQLALTRAQSDGIASINAMTDSAKVEAATVGMSAEQALAYSTAQAEINRQLQQGRSIQDINVDGIKAAAAEYARIKIAADAYAQSLQAIRDAQLNAFTSFIDNLAQGKTAMEALASATTGLLKTLDDLGAKQLFNTLTGQAGGFNLSGSFSLDPKSTQSAVSAGVQDGLDKFTVDAQAKNSNTPSVGGAGVSIGGGNTIGAGLAGAGALAGTYFNGQKTQDPGLGAGTGALSGGLAGASLGFAVGGPVGAGIGAAIGAIGGAVLGWLGSNSAKDQQHQQDVSAWQGAQQAAATFQATLLGDSPGSLTTAFIQSAAQVTQFATAAAKAGDMASVAALQTANDESMVRLINEFQRNFGGMIEALNSGLGANSPIVAAEQNVKQIGDTLKGFIADTRTAGIDVGTAQRATQTYALSLLQATPVLTDTAKAIQSIQGTATQLQQTLVDLGMSAQDAATAINTGVTAALAKIAGDFATGLARDINQNQGKSYINDIADAIKALQNNLADAASLGGGELTVLANQDFTSKAQSIVDGAQLVGTAFNDLILSFPQLAGVVHEFVDTQAAAAAATAAAAKVAQDATEKLSLQLRLLTATTDSSTLSGALALFDAKAQQERDAAAAAGSGNLVLLEQVQAAERQQIIDNFGKQAADAEKQLADQRLSQIQRIQDYLNNLTGGSNSTLSPSDRLAAAQSQFSTQLGAAQGGDQNAISSITSYSDNLLQAARAYYGSSIGYQSILAQVQNSLTGLIGTGLVGSVASSGLPGSSSAIPGVSGTTSAPAPANSNMSLSDVVAAIGDLSGKVVVLQGKLDAVRNSVDTGNKVVAQGFTDEKASLDAINGTLENPPGLALAGSGPR